MRFHQLLLRAERVVRRTIRALPPDLREPAEALPFIFEPAPTPDMAGDGIEPDTLGLFVGSTRFDEPSADVLPSQILIFLNNIWNYTDGDPAAFDQEVRTTYLHELGHYLGLEEGDLEKRGLD